MSKAKKMIVNPIHNHKFMNKAVTPDQDQYIYSVEIVTNATVPAVFDMLTKAELQAYCELDDWTVIVQKCK